MIRSPLNPGEVIQLGHREYTIKSILGDGATCIVYSAYVVDYIVSHILHFSDERRQRILKKAICSEEATKEEVLSFLQTTMKDIEELSHEKLEKDYQYVSTL